MSLLDYAGIFSVYTIKTESNKTAEEEKRNMKSAFHRHNDQHGKLFTHTLIKRKLKQQQQKKSSMRHEAEALRTVLNETCIRVLAHE